VSHYRQAHWFAVPLDQRGANALTLGIRARPGIFTFRIGDYPEFENRSAYDAFSRPPRTFRVDRTGRLRVMISVFVDANSDERFSL
jgi:hypothetical protein